MLSCQIAAEHFDFNHHEVIPQYALWAYFILRQQYFIFPKEIFHFHVRENFTVDCGKIFPQSSRGLLFFAGWIMIWSDRITHSQGSDISR
jgi:hypothetical protein